MSESLSVPTDGPNLRLGSRKGAYCPKGDGEASRCSIVGETCSEWRKDSMIESIEGGSSVIHGL